MRYQSLRIYWRQGRGRAGWLALAAVTVAGLLSVGASAGAVASAGPAKTGGGASRPAVLTEPPAGVPGSPGLFARQVAVHQIPGLSALNVGGFARVDSVSCASPGNCAAVGAYTDARGKLQAFAADERHHFWRMAIGLPTETSIATGNAEAVSVSCASPGNCTAGGATTGDVERAFVVSETNGVWGQPMLVPGAAAVPSQVFSVSCVSAGSCAVVGDEVFGNSVDPFIINQKDGQWGRAFSVPGETALDTGHAGFALSVSCVSALRCAAGGDYTDSAGSHPSWVAGTDSMGTWGGTRAEPGVAGGHLNVVLSPQVAVSCGAPGDCTAGGYTDMTPSGARAAWILSEVNFAWGPVLTVPGLAALAGPGGFSRITGVSCPAAGDCAISGEYGTSVRDHHAFVATEANGTWGNATEVRGIRAVNAGSGLATASVVSCSAPGDCVVGGSYTDSLLNDHAFVVTQTRGVWGAAQALTRTGTEPQVSSVSCSATGGCALVGDGADASHAQQGFVLDLLFRTAVLVRPPVA